MEGRKEGRKEQGRKRRKKKGQIGQIENNGFQNWILKYFWFNSEFNCVYFSLLLWGLGKKQTRCRKQRFNNLAQQMVWQLQETRALQV